MKRRVNEMIFFTRQDKREESNADMNCCYLLNGVVERQRQFLKKQANKLRTLLEIKVYRIKAQQLCQEKQFPPSHIYSFSTYLSLSLSRSRRQLKKMYNNLLTKSTKLCRNLARKYLKFHSQSTA